MRTLTLLLTALAAVVLIAPASAEDAASPRPEDGAKKIKSLQQERIATLKEMVDIATKLFKNGRTSFDEIYDAKLMLVKAELGVAEKDSDRITLYENLVNELNQYEEIAKARKDSAQAPHSLVLKVKARRLEAQIDLERAKAIQARAAK